MKQNGSLWAIGFAAGIILFFAGGVLTDSDVRYMGTLRSNPQNSDESAIKAEEEMVPQVGTDFATIVIDTQTPGITVLVEHVELNTAGWVVVHEIDSGHVLNALGAQRLDSGNHEGVVIELLRATDPGREYAIVLYSDNGNKEFEVRGDLPMIDVKGNPLMKAFRTYGGGAGIQ